MDDQTNTDQTNTDQTNVDDKGNINKKSNINAKNTVHGADPTSDPDPVHKSPKSDYQIARDNEGLLPQYAHLTGIDKAMPVIRQLLGVPANGAMPDNFIGRTMQRFIEVNRQEALRKGVTYQHETVE